jgi:hypothetical protein
MPLLGRPLTYANVVSSIALFAALGGGAYAASGGFVAGGAVRFCVSKSGSVSAVKVGKSCKHAITTLVVNQQGVAGTNGTNGTNGAQGPAGPSTGPAGGDLTGNYPNPLIGPEKVTATTLANESVTTSKLAKASVRAADLGTITEVSASEPIASGTFAAVSVNCPAGTVLISGGFQPANFGVNATSSLRAGNGWEYQADNQSGGDSTLQVFAYCLQA